MCRCLLFTPLPFVLSPCVPCTAHRAAAAVPSKGGRRVKDPTASSVPDPGATPSAKDFEKNDNYGVVTAWWVWAVWGVVVWGVVVCVGSDGAGTPRPKVLCPVLTSLIRPLPPTAGAPTSCGT